MSHIKYCSVFFVVAQLLVSIEAYAQSKHEVDVFGKWLAWQQIYNDRNISELCDIPDETTLFNFSNNYQHVIPQLKPLTQLLSTLTNNLIQPDGCQLAPPLDSTMKTNLHRLYQIIESDFTKFIEYLINNGMCNDANTKSENAIDHLFIIEKYKALVHVLFGQDDAFKESEYGFTLGNRLFEYCYSNETFSHYQNIMTDATKFPIARFINAILWHQLVGEGWKHWHAATIKKLKELADEGNEIVYIAGGTDIYHLLRAGIYNITVIDPFLPTQNRFYSEGWDYLISAQALGDEIRFGPSCNSIKMKCESYNESDTFTYKLSDGNILSAKKADIIWNVYNRDNKKIGRVLFVRRPVTQSDFDTSQSRVLVMSYDEMTFVAMPEILQGWNIDPCKLSEDLMIHIKQCRKSVDKQMLWNLRIASMLNFADLKFINLASNPT